MTSKLAAIIKNEDLSELTQKRDDLIFQVHLIDQEIQRYKIKAKREQEEKAERVLGILSKNSLSIDDLERIINRVIESKKKEK